jgi:hypothetical protein
MVVSMLAHPDLVIALNAASTLSINILMMMVMMVMMLVMSMMLMMLMMVMVMMLVMSMMLMMVMNCSQKDDGDDIENNVHHVIINFSLMFHSSVMQIFKWRSFFQIWTKH